MDLTDLSKEGKEELALAIYLWKDFKSQGKLDVKIFKQSFEFVKCLGVEEEYNELMRFMPPFSDIFKKVQL